MTQDAKVTGFRVGNHNKALVYEDNTLHAVFVGEDQKIDAQRYVSLLNKQHACTSALADAVLELVGAASLEAIQELKADPDARLGAILSGLASDLIGLMELYK